MKSGNKENIIYYANALVHLKLNIINILVSKRKRNDKGF